MAKKGMDICYHQGNIDFSKAKADGIDFIIPRDGWGTDHMDPKLKEYAQNARNAGIEVPGVYHFIYALDLEQAIRNAENAVQNVKAAGLQQTTIIWCDLEYDTVDNARDRGVELTAETQREFAEAFCNYILAAGYPTGIYLNRDYLENVYGADITENYDIWLADLTDGEAKTCVYKQYNWHGKINGCPTDVDLDEYIGAYTAETAKLKEKNMPRLVYSEKQLKTALKELARSKSSYSNKYPKNLLYWDGERWHADCNNLYKALFNGRDIHNPRMGSYQQDLSNTGDVDEWGLMRQCTDISQDFTKLGNKFECMYLKQGKDTHFGGYMGEEWEEPGQGIVNCVESTPAWEDGIQFSYVDSQGRRFWKKGGAQRGTWICHGVPSLWIDYSKSDQNTAESAQNPVENAQNTEKEIKINMDKFISFLPWIRKGSSGETVTLLQKCLQDLGYYTDTVDGNAGNNTEKAMKEFQQAAGLYPDGVFGTKSWGKLLEI